MKKKATNEEKFRMYRGNGNRYCTFKGKFEGEEITFKFTYKKDTDEQVLLKTKYGILPVSLAYFNEMVTPIRDIRGFFIPVIA